MTTTNGGQNQGQDNAAAQNAEPQLSIVAQYIKDLSFENPNAPQALAPNQPPQINIQINVSARPLSDADIEVSLALEGKAENNGNVVFSFDLDYAGVFRIRNIPEESKNAVVLIECPRLLFPFAREIIATTVRNGGFPPLMLDPIDFVALFRQRMAQAQPANA